MAGALINKYGGFHNPVAKVLAGGQEIKATDGIYLERVEVTASVDREPDMAVLVYRAFKLPQGTLEGLEKYFALGQRMEIKAGYGDCVSRIFLGYLHEIQVCDMAREYVEYLLVCLDVKGLMKKNRVYLTSGTAKAQQVFKDIVEDAGYGALIEKKSIAALPSGMNRACVIKGETHYDWLCGLAEYLDYEFFAGRGEMIFRRARMAGGEPMELTREQGLRSSCLTASLTRQTGRIQVQGHNRKDEIIVGTAKWEGIQKPFGDKIPRLLRNFELSIWDMEMETGEQATQRAQAIMKRISAEAVCMEAVNVGLPELEPGIRVKLGNDKVTSVSGTMYVKEVRHLLGQRGYQCILKGVKV